MNMNEQSFLAMPARKSDKWLTSNYHDCLAHTHKNMQLVQGRSQVEKARQIASTLGVSVAAGYLRNRGWSVESAVVILCGG